MSAVPPDRPAARHLRPQWPARRPAQEPSQQLLALDYFARRPRQLLRVAGQYAEWSKARPETTLQRQRGFAGHVWLPLDGELELRCDGEVVGHVAPGAVAGELAVLLGHRSATDIVTTADTSIVSLPGRAFHGLLGDARFATEVAGRQARAAAAILDESARQARPSGMLST